MPLAFAKPNPGYVLYIDEAVDTGLKKVRPLDADGASEWLVIGGVLIRSAYADQTVEWVRSLRSNIKGAQRPDLHFRALSEARKAAVCTATALLPIRGFALLSNKKNIRGYRNHRAEAARPSTHEWLYNFCVRLLLERVTDYIAQRSMRDYGEIRHLELVFSRRGGMRYTQTKEYHAILKNEAQAGLTMLTKREVDWRVLHPHLINALPPTMNAGVQIADVIASAFYQAADATNTTWSPDNAKLLRRIMATENRLHRDYGVALQPTPPYRAKLTERQKEIFRFYGYIF
jgi:hypothetical protein